MFEYIANEVYRISQTTGFLELGGNVNDTVILKGKKKRRKKKKMC
jgi:hypothetical protein